MEDTKDASVNINNIVIEKLDILIEAQEVQQQLLEDAIEQLHNLDTGHKGGFEYEQ